MASHGELPLSSPSFARRCNLEDRCCSEYELCVSCCLRPDHKAAELAPTTPKFARMAAAGTWGNAFEYCSGICRSHGRSTVHENAYISDRHHCFSRLGRPMVRFPPISPHVPPRSMKIFQLGMVVKNEIKLPCPPLWCPQLSEPVPSGALEGVHVLMSDAGQSCDEACNKGAGGKRCSAEHLVTVNSCDRWAACSEIRPMQPPSNFYVLLCLSNLSTLTVQAEGARWLRGGLRRGRARRQRAGIDAVVRRRQRQEESAAGHVLHVARCWRRRLCAGVLGQGGADEEALHVQVNA